MGETMTREEKELIVKVIASATDKVPTKTFAKLTRYFFEPRSCESCKWYDGSHACKNENSIAYKTENRVYGYDGCKEDYERKQDD